MSNSQHTASPTLAQTEVPPATFVNVASIPWSSFPGAEHCAQFKLLRIDPETLGHTIVLRYRTGAGTHRHLGSVEILSFGPGRWSYEGEGTAQAGDYTYEFAGATHTALTENDEWVEAVVFSRGPLQMVNEDGSLGVVIDAFDYYNAAAANNAVAHLPNPFGR